MRRFEVNLAHVDKEMYETIDLRAAQHPQKACQAPRKLTPSRH